MQASDSGGAGRSERQLPFFSLPFSEREKSLPCSRGESERVRQRDEKRQNREEGKSKKGYEKRRKREPPLNDVRARVRSEELV